jgi:hypothetical protein
LRTKATEFSSVQGNMKETRYYAQLDVDGRIILKWILKK